MNPFAEDTEDTPRPRVVKLTGALADKLYTMEQELSKKVKALKEYEAQVKALREDFINNLPKDSSGIMGKVGRVKVTVKVKPTVEDWPSLYAHIKKTGSFELLQKRLGEAAVKERWDDKKEIPGVGRFNAVGLSVVKV